MIPKKKKPERIIEFRPIRLCIVVYNLIFKVLANRLKHVLHFVISGSESTFILVRPITDNILVAYKMIHILRKKKRLGKTENMPLKLDMIKTYDRIKWDNLE